MYASIHGIFQARVLEWGAIAFSMDILSFNLIPFSFIFKDPIQDTLLLSFVMSPETSTDFPCF